MKDRGYFDCTNFKHKSVSRCVGDAERAIRQKSTKKNKTISQMYINPKCRS